jgi:hypothetical protein
MMNSYLDTNLILLNLLIGLCRGAAGLPRDLQSFGFAVHSIEQNFKNASDEIVKPEIILRSPVLHCTLLFECKAGKVPDEDQLARYSRLTKEDLQQRAFVGPQNLSTFDVVYVCVTDNLDSVMDFLKGRSFQPPLLSCGPASLALVLNHFSEPKLTELFKRGLPIAFEHIPTSFIPLHHTSPDWEFAESICPKIVQYMHENQSRILLSKLCRDVIPAWEDFSDSERKPYKDKIRAVLDSAAHNELRGYLVRSKAQDPQRQGDKVWEVASNPCHIRQRNKKTAGLKSLRTRCKRLITRLRTGRAATQQTELEL